MHMITLWVSGKVLFKVYRNGRFILEEGDYDFFRWEIIDPTLVSALQPVRDFKKAKIYLIDVSKSSLIKSDPLHPIIDIVESSISKHDYVTARGCIERSGNAISVILETHQFTQEEEGIISQKLYNYIIRAGEFALFSGDEGFVVPMVSESERIGRIAIDKKLEILAVKMISSLGHIGKIGAERELMLVTNLAVTLLGTLGVLAVRTRLEEASQAARRSLKAITKILVAMERKDLLIIMEKADQYSRDIGAAMKKAQ